MQIKTCLRYESVESSAVTRAIRSAELGLEPRRQMLAGFSVPPTRVPPIRRWPHPQATNYSRTCDVRASAGARSPGLPGRTGASATRTQPASPGATAPATPRDHVTEVNDGMRGIRNTIHGLNRILSDERLTAAERTAARRLHSIASRALDSAEDYLRK